MFFSHPNLRNLKCDDTNTDPNTKPNNAVCLVKVVYIGKPREGSVVVRIVRIDPLRFLAGYHKRRLNQALSVPSLCLDFFDVCVVQCC